MHHRARAILGLIAALSTPAVAQPQGTPAPASDPDVELEGAAEGAADRAPEPEAPAAPTPEPAAPVATPAPGFTWQPFGYLRLQYRMLRNDPNVAFVGRDDGFELQNARVGVTGALGNRVEYVISIDGAVDERTQINVPEGKLRVGLRDAYVDVPVAGTLAVRAGAFKTLVDPDVDSDVERAFVDRPLESRGVRATEGYQTQGLPPGRSLGAALRVAPRAFDAGAPRLGFELAVQNGADEFASNNDNDTPAVSATVLARLPGIGPGAGFVVASGRFNRRTEGDLPFRQDEDDLQASIGARIVAGAVAIGGGGMVVRTTFPSVGGPVRNGYGAHGQLLVRVPGAYPMAVGYRFGILDPSSLILTDRVMEHTAGMVLAVPAYRLRVQLQVTHVIEQRNLTNDRAQLAAEVSL